MTFTTIDLTFLQSTNLDIMLQFVAVKAKKRILKQ